MAKFHTHYEKLNVSANATDDEINDAYDLLLKKYNPENFEGDKKEQASRIIESIRKSYDILLDPIKRTEHDAWIQLQENVNNPTSEKIVKNIEQSFSDASEIANKTIKIGVEEIKNIGNRVDVDAIKDGFQSFKDKISDGANDAKERLKHTKDDFDAKVEHLKDDVKKSKENAKKLKDEQRLLTQQLPPKDYKKFFKFLLKSICWLVVIGFILAIIALVFSKRNLSSGGLSSLMSISNESTKSLKKNLIESILGNEGLVDGVCDSSENVNIIYEKSGISHHPRPSKSSVQLDLPAMALEIELTCVDNTTATKIKAKAFAFGVDDDEFGMIRCFSLAKSYESTNDYKYYTTRGNLLISEMKDCEFNEAEEVTARLKNRMKNF
jgi:curved DNA-binding protein CbpA